MHAQLDAIQRREKVRNYCRIKSKATGVGSAEKRLLRAEKSLLCDTKVTTINRYEYHGEGKEGQTK